MQNYRIDKRNEPNLGDMILNIVFFHDNYVYEYSTEFVSNEKNPDFYIFSNQVLKKKRYSKKNASRALDNSGMSVVESKGVLSEDTAVLYCILVDERVQSLYFPSEDIDKMSYDMAFELKKRRLENIADSLIGDILSVFDDNITDLRKMDDGNYEVVYKDNRKSFTEEELMKRLSSGTNKGFILYMYLAVSLVCGYDLIVDEIENHFHKTIVDNMISLYKDRRVNSKGATLIFTTHNADYLDLSGRQDNIWILKSDEKVQAYNMESFGIRKELSKSRGFYDNSFDTSVDYEKLMKLKKDLTA